MCCQSTAHLEQKQNKTKQNKTKNILSTRHNDRYRLLEEFWAEGDKEREQGW
jgi:hypothetical protein